jgi:hypothetical protein
LRATLRSGAQTASFSPATSISRIDSIMPHSAHGNVRTAGAAIACGAAASGGAAGARIPSKPWAEIASEPIAIPLTRIAEIPPINRGRCRCLFAWVFISAFFRVSKPGSVATGSGDLDHYADCAGHAPAFLCDGAHNAEKNAHACGPCPPLRRKRQSRIRSACARTSRGFTLVDDLPRRIETNGAQFAHATGAGQGLRLR